MTPGVSIALLGLAAGLLFVLAGWLLIGRRLSPLERERARRAFIAARGRVTEAEILEVEADHIGYQYEVAGVAYQVTQDIAMFKEIMPRDAALLLGPAMVKYLPANPANSIVISEAWSGIRLARPLQPRE